MVIGNDAQSMLRIAGPDGIFDDRGVMPLSIALSRAFLKNSENHSTSFNNNIGKQDLFNLPILSER
jgi:hypothetical protein